MKKICILSVVNLKHMTLVSLYTDYFDRMGIKYDIICVDKYGTHEENNADKFYAYPLKIQRQWSKARKIIEYFKFRKFACEILKKNNYDLVIVWNSYTAHLFSGYLKNKMKRKYIVNIRDYAHENNPIIYLLFKSVLKFAAFNTISSAGFKSFLPNLDYVTTHSLNKSILSDCKPKNMKRSLSEPIRISFIGYVRFFDVDKLIMDSFANDNRFIIQFFGEGAHILEEYSINKGYTNMRFNGRFEPNETNHFLEETDVINNLYGVGNIALDTALSIKTYYAAYMKIPIMVFKNTYMEKISTEYKFGYVAPENFQNLANDFYEWYKLMSFDELVSGCDSFLKEVSEKNQYFTKKLESVLVDDIFNHYKTGDYHDRI